MEKKSNVETACDMFQEYAAYMIAEGICLDLDDLREMTNAMIDSLAEEFAKHD